MRPKEGYPIGLLFWVFNGPLRQYYTLYRAVSEREGEIVEEKLLSAKLEGRPGTGSLPSTIAPPDHPRCAPKEGYPIGLLFWVLTAL